MRFQNGYSKNASWLLGEFKGLEIKEIEHEHFNNGKVDVFAIKLGEIIDKKIKSEIQIKNKCVYDDFACRVYEFCGSLKCAKRAKKLRETDI